VEAQPNLPTQADALGKRYGQRPSSMLGMDSPWEALIFDAICADRARAQASAAGDIPAMLAALGVL
jgi:hypothetical protein